MVQELEVKLGVVLRWLLTHAEWKAAVILVGMCLNNVWMIWRALIVLRMFELTKMNMSQTGV